MTEKLYTIKQLVDQNILGLSNMTIREKIDNGDLGHYDMSSGNATKKRTIRIGQSHIDAYLEKCSR